MEWSATGDFEDRASFTFVNRGLTVPDFRFSRANGWLTIETSDLTIRYKEKSGRFDKDNLSIEYAVNGRRNVWHPGMRDTGNLRGTIRTLDSVEGAATLEIVPFVLVGGPENFGRVEAPDFTADTATAGDQSGEPAEVQEGASDVPIVHERRPSGEQPVRGLAAHQRAVEEEEGRFSARGQAA
jgi:hypothetical protein